MSMALDDSVDQWLSKRHFIILALLQPKNYVILPGVKVSREHSSLNTKQSMEKIIQLI